MARRRPGTPTVRSLTRCPERRFPAGARSLAVGASAGEAMLWRLLRMGSAPYFVLGSSVTQVVAPAHRDPVGLEAAFRIGPLRGLPPRGRATPGGLAGHGARTRVRTTPRGGGARRGAVEPRAVRRASRGEGLPRYAPSPRAGLLSPAVTPFDLSVFDAPLDGARAAVRPDPVARLRPVGPSTHPSGHRGSLHTQHHVGAAGLQRRQRAGVHRTAAQAGVRWTRLSLRHC